jgi:hypothetical protein
MWVSESWTISDEGAGRFHLMVDEVGHLGIYKQDGDRIVICYQTESKGRPMSFRAGDGQHLLILYRVKPGK